MRVLHRRLLVDAIAALLLLISLSGLVPPSAGEPLVPGAASREAALLPPALPEPPVLRVEAPPALTSLAARVEGYDRSRLVTAMTMLGLEDPGPPIRVVLAVEGSSAARAAPSWATGYAYGSEGIVVLIPSRAPSYPYGSLEAVLHHEVAHVLVSRAAAGRPVPRWFNEGVAMAAARAWNFEDRTRLVIELLPGGRLPFDEVDALFTQGEGAAGRAYALSGAFVRDLLRDHGVDLPGRILARIAHGSSFEEAFALSTGSSIREAQQAFYRRQNIWNRWVPFLTSSLTLWTAITLLAVWAIRKRREKDARLKAEWEQEETVVPPFPGAPPDAAPPMGEN